MERVNGHSFHKQETYEGLCPSCGEFDLLDVNSGWCASCYEASVPAGICIRCKREFPQDNNGGRRICSTCRKVEWFHRNGDALDQKIAEGYSINAAIQYVTNENRPTCLSCGRVIRNGTKGRHIFCQKFQKCRTASRRFRYYRDTKGLNAQEALQLVKEGILVDTITEVHNE